MKINSISQKSGNKYLVVIDNEKYMLYDDVILKYGLYNKKDIDDKLLKDIKDDQNYYTAYYKMISFLSYKMRTEQEVRNKLRSYHLGNSLINQIITKLKEDNYLNEQRYLQSYFHDQINLSLKGPLKIMAELKKIGYNEDEINDMIDNIDKNVWLQRINKVVQKKQKANHNLSCKMFNIKIISELKGLGYSDSLINEVGYINFDDVDIKKKMYDKYLRMYQKKYSPEKLDKVIKQKMYQLGFEE